MARNNGGGHGRAGPPAQLAPTNPAAVPLPANQQQRAPTGLQRRVATGVLVGNAGAIQHHQAHAVAQAAHGTATDDASDQGQDDAGHDEEGAVIADEDEDNDDDAESHASSFPPSYSTRLAGSQIESWIDHLQDPPAPESSIQERSARALSSAGTWHDNDAVHRRPTPEVEAQPVDARRWYRDPVMYCLLSCGIVLVLLWIVLLCIWLVWRYLINPVEFEYVEKMRRQDFGL
ncbi:uncharacterized protein LTR77_001651 [Saxophila tyrrhenica]|uniref:Uncharacterized protein n=1 Tax=Saxophila tyrrhenica TaxID=1690608 RepID=A0AAV9PLE0_9PEZI|nr:hypothetical protein LTR77_001651 [Saxophila tyrrhenica]